VTFASIALGLVAAGLYVAVCTPQFVHRFFGDERAQGVRQWSVRVAGVGAVVIGLFFGVAAFQSVHRLLQGG
jgi:hypothetical protein